MLDRAIPVRLELLAAVRSSDGSTLLASDRTWPTGCAASDLPPGSKITFREAKELLPEDREELGKFIEWPKERRRREKPKS